MGVYIDMEMPASCPCELLGIGYDLYCSFAGGIPARVKEYYECCQNGTRPSWCPLVPIPPHGRLIDADALDDLLMNLADNECTPKVFASWLSYEENAPTIIPANPAEEDK